MLVASIQIGAIPNYQAHSIAIPELPLGSFDGRKALLHSVSIY